ncbi:MAG TPA: hemerythrin domain-containing protein [Burkholderiales bacterium]|nr:hemerythrin domain-containing protein [Burkholderiales bacterium]
MDMNRQVNRRLHEEHMSTLALWNQFEQAIAARAGAWPPAAEDAEIERLLRSCAVALAEELWHHFEFEESELFPRMVESGEGDIAELLAEEHATIRAAAQAFSAALETRDWQQLRSAGLELAERLVAHVHKEEMSLLPAIEDLLDEETDAQLALAYAS